MGRREENQPPAKLFFALMAREEDVLLDCEARLAAEFGPVDLRDTPYDFDSLTDYYSGEFGLGLHKQIVSIGPLVAPDRLVEIKIRTNELELALGAEGGARRVNIDPGYLVSGKVVLATTKDHAHRIYVGRGIFEEVTLSYLRAANGYVAQPWTYPDYKMPGRLAFFGRLRETYRRQLRETQ
jgi:hypothetical protein